MEDIKEKQRYFKDIYEKEVDRIFRFIFFRISDKEESVDITEEVFYKFWQVICKGEKIDHPEPLLFMITRNKVIDWYRKRKANYSLEQMDEGAEENETRSFQVEDEKAYKDMVISNETMWVMKVLQKLPEHYREVVQMRFVDDLSPEQIANILDISTNAASMRINHALKKLRTELGIDIKNE